MEAFFEEHKGSYLKQVAAFKPPSGQASSASSESGGDTSIGARIRPLLPKEVEDGEVAGISVRSEAGYADVHELRRKVNGQPSLNVRVLALGLTLEALMDPRSHLASDLTRSMDQPRPQRMSTMTLLHRWCHGRGEAESALCLHTARPGLGRRTVSPSWRNWPLAIL